MSASEDMVVAKLKGHKLNMSTWQYAEAQSHIDPEMLYIVEHAVIHFTIGLGARDNYRVVDLCKTVAEIVSKTLTERENHKGVISITRTAKIMSAQFDNLTNVTGQFEVANELLIYAVNDILIQIKYNAC